MENQACRIEETSQAEIMTNAAPQGHGHRPTFSLSRQLRRRYYDGTSPEFWGY
jgi:hypothetical protein